MIHDHVRGQYRRGGIIQFLLLVAAGGEKRPDASKNKLLKTDCF